MERDGLKLRKYKAKIDEDQEKEKTVRVPKSLRWFVVCFVVTLFCGLYAKECSINELKTKLGIEAVKCLYQFTDSAQLQMNMIDLKAITTDAVYNQLTIDNEKRSLYTYVKFYDDITSVKIIKATPNYVLYGVQNDNVEQERRFIFMFDCNSAGKIVYVREAEIYDFTSYYD